MNFIGYVSTATLIFLIISYPVKTQRKYNYFPLEKQRQRYEPDEVERMQEMIGLAYDMGEDTQYVENMIEKHFLWLEGGTEKAERVIDYRVEAAEPGNQNPDYSNSEVVHWKAMDDMMQSSDASAKFFGNCELKPAIGKDKFVLSIGECGGTKGCAKDVKVADPKEAEWKCYRKCYPLNADTNKEECGQRNSCKPISADRVHDQEMWEWYQEYYNPNYGVCVNELGDPINVGLKEESM